MNKMPFTVTIYRSVDEIAPHAWADIFPSVVENYQFYKVIEKTLLTDYQFYYITIYRDSKIICLVPAFITEFALDTTIKGPLKNFTLKLRKRFPHWLILKVFICGSPLSGGKLGVIDQDQPEIAYVLNETISSLTKKEKINIFAFKDFHQTYTKFLDHLLTYKFHKIHGFPFVELKIDFKSFDEYLARLSKSTRKGLKKKFKLIDNQPHFEIEVRDNLGELVDEAYQLYLNTLKKSEIQFEVLPKSFFELIATYMPQETKFFLWKLNGKLVAFDLCLASGNQMIDEYIGLDYTVAHQYQLYFDTYRVIIQWCIANGIQSYEAGALNYDPKKRLDFAFIPQYIYTKHRNPIINIFFRFLGFILKPENFDPVLRSMKKDSTTKKSNIGVLTFGIFWLVILSDFIESLGELFYKKAALSTGIDNIVFSNFTTFATKIIINENLWIGISFYILNFFLWIIALSKADLSVVYPIGSTSYIIVMILSMVFLHEHITVLRWIGVCFIILGIYFIFQSTHKRENLNND